MPEHKKATLRILRNALEVSPKRDGRKALVLEAREGVVHVHANDGETYYRGACSYVVDARGAVFVPDGEALKRAYAKAGVFPPELLAPAAPAPVTAKSHNPPAMAPVLIRGRGVRLLERVAFAMANKDRVHMHGVRLEWDAGVLRAVTSDGHRVAIATAPAPGAVACTRGITVPARTVRLACKLFEKSTDLSIATSNESVLFVTETERLVARPVPGRFPPYEQIIPTNRTGTATINREELRDAVEAVGGFSAVGCAEVRLDKDAVSVTETRTYGGATLIIPATVKGHGQVYLSADLLVEGLDAIGDWTVCVALYAPSVVRGVVCPAPVVVTSAGDATGYTYVLMPTRR